MIKRANQADLEDNLVNNFNYDPQTEKATMLRTFILMGAPIVSFKDELDQADRQNVYVLGFHEELKDYVDQFNELEA